MSIIRTGLSSQNVSISRSKGLPAPTMKPQVGKVYGVVTTKDTPTKELFDKAGGFNGIGTVFYRTYNTSKEVSENVEASTSLSMALPLNPSIQSIPLIGELIHLLDLPSPVSQAGKNKSNTAGQKYYTNINVWNNVQQNSLPSSDKANLGVTFLENPSIKPLLPFEGDYIVQGRQGSALRFSSTTKLYSDLNEWSNVGNDQDPITILSNGFSYDPSGSYHVEKINKDLSSIYLTSAQQLPLETNKTGVLNPLTKPIDVSKYFNAQIIINSDRVVLNSKRDEVMIFAKSNIELNTKNIINLNADERVHLNSNTVFLGTVNNNLPTEPLVLGDKLNTLLENLLDSLYSFGNALSSVVGSPEGAPAIDINMAAEGLLNDIDRINDNLEGILSQQNFTA
jgi:hypothetical protein